MAKKKSIAKKVRSKIERFDKKAKSKILDVLNVSHPGYAAMLKADLKKKKRK